MNEESQQLPMSTSLDHGGSIKKVEEEEEEEGLDSSNKALNDETGERPEPISPSTNGVDLIAEITEDETPSDNVERHSDCKNDSINSLVDNQLLISNSEKSEIELETNSETKESENQFTCSKEEISDLIVIEEKDCTKLNQGNDVSEINENKSLEKHEELVEDKNEEIEMEVSEPVENKTKDALENLENDELEELKKYMAEGQINNESEMEGVKEAEKDALKDSRNGETEEQRMDLIELKDDELEELKENASVQQKNNESEELKDIELEELRKDLEGPIDVEQKELRKESEEQKDIELEKLRKELEEPTDVEFKELKKEFGEPKNVELEELRKELEGPKDVELEELRKELEGPKDVELEELRKESEEPRDIELEELRKESVEPKNVELEELRKESEEPKDVELEELRKELEGPKDIELKELKEESKEPKDIELEELRKESVEPKNVELEELRKESEEPKDVELEQLRKELEEPKNVELEELGKKSEEPKNVELEELRKESEEPKDVELEELRKEPEEPKDVELEELRKKSEEPKTIELEELRKGSEEPKDVELKELRKESEEPKDVENMEIDDFTGESQTEISESMECNINESEGKIEDINEITKKEDEKESEEIVSMDCSEPEEKMSDVTVMDISESVEPNADESKIKVPEMVVEQKNETEIMEVDENTKDENSAEMIEPVEEKENESTESVEQKKEESRIETTESAEEKKEDEMMLDISKLSPKSIDLGTETQDSQEDLNEEDFKEKEIFDLESEKEQNKSSSGMSNINTSGELDEENLSKSENEMMDPEMLNCNEIEQIDLNETELQKEKEDKYEVIDEKIDSKEENDVLEMDTEKLKPVDVLNEPENSEEETITGDTNQSEKANEHLCIIPDDVSRLPVLPQESSKETKDTTEKSAEKPRAKGRPVRNAAKLAGDKIKSLVDNCLLPEQAAEEGDVSVNKDEDGKMCAHCKEVKVCKFVVQGDSPQYLCSQECSNSYKTSQIETEGIEIDGNGEFIRRCGQCRSQVTVDEKCLFWETMDFCSEDCLEKYQKNLGSCCANCKGNVPPSSLGKYCVRFGYDVKQFCSSSCLDEYKKGLKVCSYCQKDISTGPEGFLAPVGDKGQFKDFCSQACMGKYERMSSSAPRPDVIEECAVCSNSKPVCVEVDLDNKTHKLCSEPCFAAFKFVNNITAGQCEMCRKYFDKTKTKTFTLFFDENSLSFCCKACMNVYILANRKIIPCNWCKVKKYNFDMIKKVNANGQLTMMCSLNCLRLYQVSVNAVCARNVKCDFCLTGTPAQYHLTMSDSTVKNFCSYNCVMFFQSKYPQQNFNIISVTEQIQSSPASKSGSKRRISRRTVETPLVPVITSTHSLASPNGPASPLARGQLPKEVSVVPPVTTPITITSPVPPMPAPPPPQIYQQIITKPPPAKEMKNKAVLCKPYSHTKGVSCRPHPCMKETQTDQSLNRKFLIPIPVPIYVPAPMHMFATPFPVPVPFPLPVPVPIFIPTTRNSAKGIMKEIKRIQEKIPTDPFEAELLMMAEMVAGDKKQDPTDSESEDGNEGDDGGDGSFSPENVDTSNTFGDDMLQMALKMASELEEPAVDMESVLTSNTITTSTQPAVDPNKALYASDHDDPDQVQVMSMNRGRKRSIRGGRNSSGNTPSKRGRRTSGSVDVPLLPPPEPVPPPRIEVEKPDANMCLKYTFGVNAWRHWVMQKNAELEKVAMTNRKIKLFKPELLQLTADELNFSLCLFVKEVRKPNGTEYAPDTIYYLCLGIQQYLFENGRIDNIFTDSYYEKFTDCLDEVAKKFAALYNDSQYIVTRVEEEHLWESKQLGAHSPHVLLSTLMFFNTKHFNLVTVEEHMQLSFSHIMKHWKRNPNTPGVTKVPGSRNVLLRFYPPQSALEANSRKKKVYEQQENEENPLRCPVKLYEFYLSKCPESVKTRNDVFYLLPERSCVPDSPVWYSTMALGKEPLMKMLHRVKMVKEINIALLTC